MTVVSGCAGDLICKISAISKSAPQKLHESFTSHLTTPFKVWSVAFHKLTTAKRIYHHMCDRGVWLRGRSHLQNFCRTQIYPSKASRVFYESFYRRLPITKIWTFIAINEKRIADQTVCISTCIASMLWCALIFPILFIKSINAATADAAFKSQTKICAIRTKMQIGRFFHFIAASQCSVMILRATLSTSNSFLHDLSLALSSSVNLIKNSSSSILILASV